MITRITAGTDQRMRFLNIRLARALKRYNETKLSSDLLTYLRAHDAWEKAFSMLERVDIARERAGRRAA